MRWRGETTRQHWCCWEMPTLTLGLVFEESVDLGGGSARRELHLLKEKLSSPVESADLESLVVHVEDQVLAL